MPRFKPSLTATAFALVIATATFGRVDVLAAPVPDTAALRHARETFQRAAAGDEAAIDDAAARWQAICTAAPADPVARAYAGSATTMRALTSWAPWKKVGYVEEGLAQIDKALAQLTPAHEQAAAGAVAPALETRLVAASTFVGLPAMFHRRDRGARMLAELAANPQLSGAPPAFRATVWLRAGQQAARDGQTTEARRWLQRAADSGQPQATQARAQLASLP